MLRVRQVEVDLNKNNIDEIKKQTAIKLKINKDKIKSININKKSIDARKKPKIKFIYEVDIECLDELSILGKNIKDVIIKPDETYKIEITGDKKINNIVIVGAGPAGLFSAYSLAKLGYKPLIIERGEKVEDRIKSVEEFWKNGKLNTNSNVQFGEGGAGTFSDGKLNTLTKDPEHRMKEVFRILNKYGAKEDILYENKPHIGTDILRKVVSNMREDIINLGGTFKFNTTLTDLIIEDNKIKGIKVNDNEIIDTDILVLAIGHSARDTFYMLNNYLDMQPKPFAVGIRIMHEQSMINNSQYGFLNHPELKEASYKLTYNTKDKRGVYSFCMCPGGYVVNASSEKNRLAINGMSDNKRDSGFANSAIVVTVNPSDFKDDLFGGLEFQRELEEKAYNLGNGKIPVQLLKDYNDNKVSESFKSIEPIFKGNTNFSNINEIFPNFINNSLKEAIPYFGTKIKGFDKDDTVIAAIESRTSSPIRMYRDDNLVSNIEGIYPSGEGAGYSGGITTSAMDGLKIAEQLAKIYKP